MLTDGALYGSVIAHALLFHPQPGYFCPLVFSLLEFHALKENIMARDYLLFLKDLKD